MKASTPGSPSPKPSVGARRSWSSKREQVLVALGDEVHRVPHAPEEVERRLQLRDVALGQHAERHQLAEGPHLELHLRHPEGGVQVAEPALPLLQLRLEEVDGVAGAGVALDALGELLLEEAASAFRAPDLVEHALLELGVEPGRRRRGSARRGARSSPSCRGRRAGRTRACCACAWPTASPASQSA